MKKVNDDAILKAVHAGARAALAIPLTPEKRRVLNAIKTAGDVDAGLRAVGMRHDEFSRWLTDDALFREALRIAGCRVRVVGIGMFEASVR